MSEGVAAAAVAILVLAYFVRGVTGFGSGLVAVPLLALLLPLGLVVPLMLFLDFAGSLVLGGLNLRRVNWGEIAVLLPPSIAGSAVGTWLLVSLAEKPTLFALGTVIVAFGIRHLVAGAPQRIVSRWWGPPAAVLGGTISALFGTGGPPFVVYLSHRIRDRAEFRATLSVLFLLDGPVRIVAFLIAGLVNAPLMIGVAVALPLLLLGLYLGHRVHVSLTDRAMSRVVGAVLVLAGTALLFKASA